jgi:hypothetical protein
LTAVACLRRLGLGPGREIRVLAASGQLGNGIPEKAFRAGLAREPHVICCDMGSIDPGPAYLGSGAMATSPEITRRDLDMVLTAARQLDVPLIIGTAGTAGARPHLDAVLAIVGEVATERALSIEMAVIAADIPRPSLVESAAAGRVRPLGNIPELDAGTVGRASHIVGQMGIGRFLAALESEPDVIIAGRACDTAVFGCVPWWLGYDKAAALHMAKIIECTSLCCVPGGRDAMLATLDGDGFVLESMNPDRANTPLSVAAHSLYEQADPYRIYEPEGVLDISAAVYAAVDERRTRVSGAVWHPAERLTVKIEGAEHIGERAVLCAASADPRVIERAETIAEEVKATVAEIVPQADSPYELIFHIYGKGGVSLFATPDAMPPPAEIFFLVECVAESAARAKAVVGVTKQFLLHHGFPGRLSTGGNIAFPFTPPELPAGSAYRFSIYHLMEVERDDILFPIRIERVDGRGA